VWTRRRGRGAELAERCRDALILIIRDTLGPWSDFIKEFGFVLPKTIKAYPISDQNADVGARITIGAIRRHFKTAVLC